MELVSPLNTLRSFEESPQVDAMCLYLCVAVGHIMALSSLVPNLKNVMTESCKTSSPFVPEGF